MRKLMFALLIAFLLGAVSFEQRGNISVAKASFSIHQGDLTLTGSNVTIIEGRFDINGSIIVEQNATLILRNALLNFTLQHHEQYRMIFRNPANGNPRLIVENATINSNSHLLAINFYENSSAILNEISTSYGIIRLYDYSSAQVLNSMAPNMSVYMQQFSVLNMSNSSLDNVVSYHNSSVAISKCTINILQAIPGFSIPPGTIANLNATIKDSTIHQTIILDSWSANYSAIRYEPGFVSHWNFRENCSVVVAPVGIVPNVILENTHVGGWGFRSWGRSNLTVIASELWNLLTWDLATVTVYNSTISEGLWSRGFSHGSLYNTMVQTLNSHWNSELLLLNSTINTCNINDESEVSIYNSTINGGLWSRGSSYGHLYNTRVQTLNSYMQSKLWLVNSTVNTCNINDQSEVYVSWYLDVHVIDKISQDVPAANVTATYPNATVAQWRLTDINGLARLTLMEKIMTATYEYRVGNYTVEATYESHLTDATVNVTESRKITLKFKDFVVPEFPSLIILPLFMVMTLIATISYRKKRST